MKKLTAIINGTLILEQGLEQDKVLVFGDKIEGVLTEAEFTRAFGPNMEIVDAQGCYVAPGLINLHVHGCGGADAMDGTEEALAVISKGQAAMGVTGYLPTTMTCPLAKIYRALEAIRAVMEPSPLAPRGNNELKARPRAGARVLGAHLEGPFISKEYKGAQREEDIRVGDYGLIEKYASVIRLMTIAPELCSDELIEQCRKAGIALSIGHSGATYEQAMAAITSQGIGHITHLYNGMTPFHHRRPGIVGAALDSSAKCEVIADNIHCHPAAQRLLCRAKPPEEILLITDSIRACGLPEGPSELGGQQVLVKNGRATLADGTIAGSVLTMNRAIWNWWHNTGTPLQEAVKMASLYPAKELGLEQQLGSLQVGKAADVVLLRDNEKDNFEIGAVWIAGQGVEV